MIPMIDFLGVSENVAYRTRKWLRVNGENDENPMDLGLHYFQTNPNVGNLVLGC